MKKKSFLFYLLLLGIHLSHALFSQPLPVQSKKPLEKSVRFVYMVSQDRKENPAYKEGIAMAATNIQAWYKKQLGTTFKLNNPIVEVVHSDQKAAWFYANPNGDKKDGWGYNNTLDEANRLLGVKQMDPDYIWVIYSDGPGNHGMGGAGVCIMPEDDLLGLIGKHPEQKEINRWIAGLGHEVGHAFGLNHPKDIVKDADALMWTGIYGKYPDACYLTEEDMEILNSSPFFFDDQGNPNSGKELALAKYEYGEGHFSRSRNLKTGNVNWLETKTDNSESYWFQEEKVDKTYYYLKSEDREIWIRIPILNGESELSTDGGATWGFFWEMLKVE